jgi:tetratricopeptide (TPR) repeat protein
MKRSLVSLVLALAAGPLAHAQFSSLVTQGRQALEAGKIDDALASFQSAVAADPQDAAALAFLGTAQVSKARAVDISEAPDWVKKGFDTLDGAVERFPDNFVVYVNRGAAGARVPAMFRKGDVAVKDLDRVVAMKAQRPEAVPDAVMPSVYLSLGLAYKTLGRASDARAAWEKAKTLSPSAREGQMIDQELQGLQ